MDVVAIERDFTAWVAEKLNLELDKGIYRGPIPAGLECGVGVLFGSEVPAAGFYGFRPRTWNVQILGKFDDRDAAMILLSCLNGLFPCAGFTCGETKIRHIEPRGGAEPYTVEDGGKVKTYVSFNLLLSVLTTGAQVKQEG